MAGDELLRLAAMDAEDLAVMSAHLQDAVLTVADMVYSPAERRFALVANRFDWEHEAMSEKGPYRRRRCGLSFDKVLDVKSRGIRRRRSDAVLELLAVEFAEAPAGLPSGAITLQFAGDAAIRLDVECIEARLTDLGPQWSTPRRPQHETGRGAET